ncbi:CoA-transferase [Streptomyces microflavus]
MTTAPERPAATTPYLASGPDDLVRRFVREGDHVHAAATMSRPNALLNAVCRAFAGSHSLTVSTTAVHSSAHALALSGAVRKVITGFVGDTFPSPRPNRLYRELAEGRPFEIEMWSLLSYTQRLMAAALGQPFATTGSMLAETDLRHGKEGSLHLVPHPEDPERSVTLLTPLRPRIALFHGVVADRRGNVVAVPPLGEGAWAAYAATDGVLASVEAIVDDEVIAAMPDRVVIPAARVLGLCEAPLGAHPQSLRTGGLAGVEGYLDDYAFLTDIVTACKDPETAAAWYEEWVGGVESHADYLERLGEERRASLAFPLPSRTPAPGGRVRRAHRAGAAHRARRPRGGRAGPGARLRHAARRDRHLSHVRVAGGPAAGGRRCAGAGGRRAGPAVDGPRGGRRLPLQPAARRALADAGGDRGDAGRRGRRQPALPGRALGGGDRPGRQHQHDTAARRPLDHRIGRGQRHRLVRGLRGRRGRLAPPLRTAPDPPHQSGPARP